MKIVLVFSFLISLNLFSTCHKLEITPEQLGVIISDETDAAFSLFDDVFENYEVSTRTFNKNYQPGDCVPEITVTDSTETEPLTILIDYGMEGCASRHGWIRKGKIIIEINGQFPTGKYICNITLDSYIVNDYLIEGTSVVTVLDSTENDNPSLKIESSGKITDPVGKKSTMNFVLTREWIEGNNTPFNYTDDVFSYSGDAEGICSEGVSFQLTITSPLLQSRNCQWIKSGIISISSPENTIIKDYGNGNCDSIVTLNINTTTNETILKW